jgi:hypothetical protein
MKANFVRSIMFAAAVLASGAIGIAQAPTGLVADINFKFRFMSKDLPGGRYVVTRVSAAPAFKLRNVSTGQSVLMAGIVAQGSRKDLSPRLVFRCTSEICGLSEVWTGDGYPGYSVPKAKLTPAEKERIAVVPLKVTGSKAD